MERVTTQVRSIKEKNEGVRAIMKYVEPLLFNYPQKKGLKVDFASSDVFAVPKLLSRQRVESEIESSASSQKLSSIFSTTLRSQALTATASVATIISLFALYYGFLYGYWAIVWCGLMTLVIIFVDMWIVASRERKRHERR